jgi:ArsR family transcriptional regulator
MAQQQIENYEDDEILIAIFSKALGHPARVAILKFLLSLDSYYFGNICDELSIARSTVSQNLDELKKAGLIQGTIDPPKVYYCINKQNWKSAQNILTSFFSQIKV